MTQFPQNGYTSEPGDVTETDKTYNTNSSEVGNQVFLDGVFGNEISGVRPILVSFNGNPNQVTSKDWMGFPHSLNSQLDEEKNNYFSLSKYVADNEGKYKRKKTQFKSLHAIMLDDIGTKVSVNQISVDPSWAIETSPGNFQYGYILEQPIFELKAADNLMSLFIKAGLSDPGASGPTARLGRLPSAVNGKHHPPFKCKISVCGLT